jgi:hypothetical protein
MTDSDHDPLYVQIPKREVPRKGMHAAVCAFVEDIGLQVSPWPNEKTGKHDIKPKIVLCFELAETMKDGRPFMFSKTETASSHPRSNLMKMLNAWLDDPPSPEDVVKRRFSLSSLIGRQAAVQVTHKSREDGTMKGKLEAVFTAKDGAEPLKVFNTEPPEWIARQREEGREDVAAAERGDSSGPARSRKAEGGERKGEGGQAGDDHFDEIPF